MYDFALRESWSDWYKERVTTVMVVMAAAFVLILLRLIHLQVIQGPQLYRMSENNCIRLQSLDPTRGLILDVNGVILADNRLRFDVFLIPRDVRPKDRILPLLASFLDMGQAEIEKKLGRMSSFTPVLVKEDIDRDVLAVVEAHRYEMPGVFVRAKPHRYFPDKEAYAHLVGYLSQISADELRNGRYPDNRSGDFIGKYGIEKQCEQYLAGKHGGRQVEVDARARTVRVMRTVLPESGNRVFLTIDARLQKKAGELFSGRVGAVAAMDPRTGRVLAMVSSPSYDPNLFVDGMTQKQWNSLVNDKNRPLENKVLQSEYPPGSVFKIITAIAGLEENIIKPQNNQMCTGGYFYGDRTFRCWKTTGHGNMDMIQAIAQSCDVYFYKLGLELGVDRLAKYSKGCGLGRPTGLGLGVEADGLVPTRAWKKQYTGNIWVPGETLSVAIGQGYNLVTPMQALCLASAVANNGTLYKPFIIDRMETARGKGIKKFTPRILGKLPVSEKNLGVVKQGLWNVVNGKMGTARSIRSKALEISGKTGTAQVVGRKDREKFLNETSDKQAFKDHAWFVAFAPRKNSEIAVVVLLEHGGHGTSAAPIARDIIKEYWAINHPETQYP